MKLTKRQLRRLIESALYEVNPAQKEDEKKQAMKKAENQYEYLIATIKNYFKEEEKNENVQKLEVYK